MAEMGLSVTEGVSVSVGADKDALKSLPSPSISDGFGVYRQGNDVGEGHFKSWQDPNVIINL